MRLAIVYPRANLDTVPSLIGAAEQLAEAGHEVDVLTYRQAGQPDPAFASASIRLRSLGVEGLADFSTAGLRGAVKRVGWLPSVARAPLVRTYNVLGAGLAGGSRLAARARISADKPVFSPGRSRPNFVRLFASRNAASWSDAWCWVFSRVPRGAVAEREALYGCVIGVDPDGLRLAHGLARGAPLGYYSLELLLSYELNTLSERQLKAHERALSQQAAFVIVQDEERGRLLAEDNALDWSRVVLVPNAPAGRARRRAERYWHARFDLPESARVVIHSGSLGDWTGIEAIVDSVAGWPADWVLVIHTRFDAES
jgi:hypothetical protein